MNTKFMTCPMQVPMSSALTYHHHHLHNNKIQRRNTHIKISYFKPFSQHHNLHHALKCNFHKIEPLAEDESSEKKKLKKINKNSFKKNITKTGVILGAYTGIFALFGKEFSIMDSISLTEALGILTAIVAVHEAGHFLAARLQNIHVTKFSIGFGPALFKYKGKKVEYAFRAIPLGGFVAFPDDDPENPYPVDDPDLLRNRPVLQRAIVISAGVLANLLFAYSILFTEVSTIGVANEVIQPGVSVPKVIKNSAADKAGIKSGDIIIAANGVNWDQSKGNVVDMVETINQHPGEKMNFLIKRGENTFPIDIIPDRSSDGKGRIGIHLESRRTIVHNVASNYKESLILASSEFIKIVNDILEGLRKIIFDFNESASQVSGPVSIVAVGADIAKSDASQLFMFSAIININLAIVNILPLPALDGGYLLLLLIEAIRNKKLPAEVENSVMTSGLLFLMVIGCLLLVKDTANLGLL